ncbi:MAG: class I SAM-dependent methyltransferase [Candidatus Altiarchaeota archaeon]
MKYKQYTKSHNLELLKKIDSTERFTSEELSWITKQEQSKEFKTRESLLRWYLSQNAIKLPALGFLIQHLNDERFKNILSLGAGPCVLEYLLKCALPEDSKVIAADFNSFYIEKAKLHFPSIIPLKFDFFNDDITELQKKSGVDFDVAVFFGSAYVMDDVQFINLFRGLKRTGVRQIIDFYAGYIPTSDLPKMFIRDIRSSIVSRLRKIPITKGILNKIKPVGSSYGGKFHGYARSHSELRRLYKEAGVNLIRETSVEPYKYVAICEC